MTPRQTALFGVVIGLTVFVQIAGHVAIALWDRRTGKDERIRDLRLNSSAAGLGSRFRIQM